MQLDPSAFLADPELIQALEKRSTLLTCDEDRVLLRKGDPPVGLYVLSQGEASISMDSESDGLGFSCQVTAGSVLGLPGLIANRPYSLTVIAHKGSRVGFVSRDAFNTLIQSEHQLMGKVLQVLAAEVRSARLAITQGPVKQG